MKFLVTGSTGLVGSQVVKDLSKNKHTIYSCYHSTKPDYGIPVELDLEKTEKIHKIIQEIKPERIIHLAALTNVDLCETEKELAYQINAKATGILAREAAKYKAFFTYVSTDYIFDGTKGMQKEGDQPNPIGYYGKSKLAGEFELNNLASSWCIARTSTPFGIHPNKKSFPLWVIENLESGKEIPVLIDQHTSPTYVPNLSRMLIEVTSRQISGIIHLAGATRISRYDMAILVAEKLNLDKNLLKKTMMKQMNWSAQRPADSSIDVSLASEILHEKPQSITESIELFTNEIMTA